MQGLTFPPATVVGGAAALMEEVAATKVSGEEDRYSHTDLWDFQGNVDGATDILQHALANNFTRLEAEQEAEQYWVGEVQRSYEKLLLRKGKGWFVGYNSNVAGHDGVQNRFPAYQGGGARFAKMYREAMSDNYRGIDIQ